MSKWWCSKNSQKNTRSCLKKKSISEKCFFSNVFPKCVKKICDKLHRCGRIESKWQHFEWRNRAAEERISRHFFKLYSSWILGARKFWTLQHYVGTRKEYTWCVEEGGGMAGGTLSGIFAIGPTQCSGSICKWNKLTHAHERQYALFCAYEPGYTYKAESLAGLKVE